MPGCRQADASKAPANVASCAVHHPRSPKGPVRLRARCGGGSWADITRKGARLSRGVRGPVVVFATEHRHRGPSAEAVAAKRPRRWARRRTFRRRATPTGFDYPARRRSFAGRPGALRPVAEDRACYKLRPRRPFSDGGRSARSDQVRGHRRSRRETSEESSRQRNQPVAPGTQRPRRAEELGTARSSPARPTKKGAGTSSSSRWAIGRSAFTDFPSSIVHRRHAPPGTKSIAGGRHPQAASPVHRPCLGPRVKPWKGEWILIDYLDVGRGMCFTPPRGARTSTASRPSGANVPRSGAPHAGLTVPWPPNPGP